MPNRKPTSSISCIMFVTFLIVAELLQLIAAAATNYAPAKCYEKARDYYPYLSTKTAYENVHGHVTRLEGSCQPAQVWMLSRHGTRYPGENIISAMQNMTTLRDEILKNHEQGAGLLCTNELNQLRDWQLDSNVRMENADVLTEQGEKEMHELAERLKNVFVDLFDTKNVKSNDFVFRATHTQRTQASMRNFYRGIFENEESPVQPEIPPVNDTLLLAHKLCPAWKTGYMEDHVSDQRDKFTAGPEVRAVIQNVGRRLGFTRDIDFPTIKSMYDMCRFETAWYPNRTSPWCLVFRGDELKVLEYREDLDYYYFAGPGRPMSAKMGCRLLSDMFERFKTLASGNWTNQPRGVFYFAHTVTLQTFMAALKLNEETKPALLASNYADVQDRHYRTSFFGPFATNIVAVFYRCSQSENPYKVTFYAAERLVKMPGCRDGLCDWKFLEQKYAPDVDQCSMDVCYEKTVNNTASIINSINARFGELMIVVWSVRVVVLSL